MDEQGWFYLVDRKKDMIIASGFKIWPREVEDMLYQHPAVREAAVIGVPDPYRGETVKAFVALKEGCGKDRTGGDHPVLQGPHGRVQVSSQRRVRSGDSEDRYGKFLRRELRG